MGTVGVVDAVKVAVVVQHGQSLDDGKRGDHHGWQRHGAMQPGIQESFDGA